MSEIIAKPKTIAVAAATKQAVVSKATAKQAPAAKARATAPAGQVQAKPAPLAPEVAPAHEKKSKKSKNAGGKIKVVRDSFTMPQSDYAKIGEFKQLCLKNGLHVKKSELLRAGLHALGKLSAAQLKAALSSLEKIETGRPKKEADAKK